MMEASQYHCSFQKWFILVLYFESNVDVMNSMFCTLAKYKKWIFQARWVQSNIKTSIYHQYLISLKNPHELRWILIMIPTHTENLCEVKKKRSLRGTSNSHNPQLTQTSAKSEASLKVRGDASTYINHEESSQEKPECPCVTQPRCVSIFSLCFLTKASITFSFLVFFFCFFSEFICFVFMFVAGYLVKVDQQTFVQGCFNLQIISRCLFCIKTHPSEYSPRLEERAAAIKVWVTV